ncbi:peptide chain release factor N(5)-glutamine methyltransferase [Legionella londiniensis]|uniref:Release factor glutamine methyltransferase n=1 Tax=Legionella londiniensis TaxID=45068 RepID=A0A0W0VSU8_9GAMM|nr:peptide chain release factor N(5)-glutamine methyltransferase [Legionella londiniensis]KTD23198.1 protein methyltransferase HemK [Legionella londiniensis]STX93791.1 HemK protein [Legionella londiniensis]
MIDVKNALQFAIRLLSGTGSSPQLDAEVLLSHVLNMTRAFLYTHPEHALNETQWKQFQCCLKQRQEGMPVSYITGNREFWSLPLKVSPDTLIPRPETELLVELTLKLAGNIPHASLLDLGTGSGAIALALASEKPAWNLLASDASKKALEIACQNAKNLNISNVTFIQSDWFSTIPQQLFDVILSNPPYIADHDPHLLNEEIRFEPRDALAGGADGLEALRHIIASSASFLKVHGWLLLEHGYNQSESVASLLEQHGFQFIQSFQDCQGHYRVTGGQLQKLHNEFNF